MTSLTSLNLQECWQITAQGLAAISGARLLTAQQGPLDVAHTSTHIQWMPICFIGLPVVTVPLLKIIRQAAQRCPVSAPRSMYMYHVPCTYVHDSLYGPAADKYSCARAGLTGMLDINLLGCRRVSELRPLRALSALTALSLRNCDGLGDAALAPLSGLLSLASLDLSGCTHLTGAG